MSTPSKTNIPYLIQLFGSAAEVARAAGVTRGAVTRWKEGRVIDRQYQISVIAQAKQRGFPVGQVARALGIRKCPNCGYIHDHLIRELLQIAALPDRELA
jgi:hypothetical protein